MTTKDSVHETVTVLVLLLLERRGPRTKGELADILGIHVTSLSHAFSPNPARRRYWHIHEIVRLAEHFRVSTDVLLGLDEVGRDRLLDELADEYHSSLKARTR